jgi:L-lactate dehydrogenase complex protein LldG
MRELERNTAARNAILGSIREHLAASATHDVIHGEGPEEVVAGSAVSVPTSSGASPSLVELFKQQLEAVGGHCITAGTDMEVVAALTRIIWDLRETPLRAQRIALSNIPTIERLIEQMEIEVDEIAVCPDPDELFAYDIGVSTAQAAIAETGTLVLESESERHRLVSLVPPVHIAIIDALGICLTLGEALALVRRGGATRMSPTITLITGPSRTADIELTLAIGVHGPQELYVIVKDGTVLNAN